LYDYHPAIQGLNVIR